MPHGAPRISAVRNFKDLPASSGRAVSEFPAVMTIGASALRTKESVTFYSLSRLAEQRGSSRVVNADRMFVCLAALESHLQPSPFYCHLRSSLSWAAIIFSILAFIVQQVHQVISSEEIHAKRSSNGTVRRRSSARAEFMKRTVSKTSFAIQYLFVIQQPENLRLRQNRGRNLKS